MECCSIFDTKRHNAGCIATEPTVRGKWMTFRGRDVMIEMRICANVQKIRPDIQSLDSHTMQTKSIESVKMRCNFVIASSKHLKGRLRPTVCLWSIIKNDLLCRREDEVKGLRFPSLRQHCPLSICTASEAATSAMSSVYLFWQNVQLGFYRDGISYVANQPRLCCITGIMCWPRCCSVTVQ